MHLLRICNASFTILGSRESRRVWMDHDFAGAPAERGNDWRGCMRRYICSWIIGWLQRSNKLSCLSPRLKPNIGGSSCGVLATNCTCFQISCGMEAEKHNRLLFHWAVHQRVLSARCRFSCPGCQPIRRADNSVRQTRKVVGGMTSGSKAAHSQNLRGQQPKKRWLPPANGTACRANCGRRLRELSRNQPTRRLPRAVREHAETGKQKRGRYSNKVDPTTFHFVHMIEQESSGNEERIDFTVRQVLGTRHI